MDAANVAMWSKGYFSKETYWVAYQDMDTAEMVWGFRFRGMANFISAFNVNFFVSSADLADYQKRKLLLIYVYHF